MSTRPTAVRPTAGSRPGAALAAPPPEHGFWARWWSRPINRVRTLVPLGLLALLLLYDLLAGR